jgi:hypothetical protein
MSADVVVVVGLSSALCHSGDSFAWVRNGGATYIVKL